MSFNLLAAKVLHVNIVSLPLPPAAAAWSARALKARSHLAAAAAAAATAAVIMAREYDHLLCHRPGSGHVPDDEVIPDDAIRCPPLGDMTAVPTAV